MVLKRKVFAVHIDFVLYITSFTEFCIYYALVDEHIELARVVLLSIDF
jgi:hypothetical protein